jgi:hypothetical protein
MSTKDDLIVLVVLVVVLVVLWVVPTMVGSICSF